LLRYSYGISTRATDYIERALELDPSWPHAAAAELFLAYHMGLPPPKPRVITGAQDPVGRALLAVLSDPATQADAARVDAMIPATMCTPHDQLCRLVRLTFASTASDERMLADAQQACGENYDDFAACAELVSVLERLGLADNARTVRAEWLAKSPTSDGAMVLDAVDRVLQGDPSGLLETGKRLKLLDADFTLGLQAELALAGGDLATAATAATRLGTQANAQDHSRYLLAVILVAQGAYTRALPLFQSLVSSKAYREHAMEALIDVQQGLGDRAAAAEVIDAWLASSEPPRPVSKIMRTMQRDLLRHPKPCPAIGKLLAPVTDPGMRGILGQSLRRLAAEHGCGTCSDVLRDGAGGFHRSSSNVVFGRCAIAEKALPAARAALTRESVLLLPGLAPGGQPAPFSTQVAQLLLAELDVQEGKRDDARRRLDALLAVWTKADRVVPQLAAAQRLRATLDAP
jgi:tetratricopeptide (TPR) repeat protein